MNTEAAKKLLLEALETELGGVEIYRTALKCVVHPELKTEWKEYLDQTTSHVDKVRELIRTLGANAEEETPGRAIVRHIGKSLVTAMEMALKTGDRKAAQLVASDCVASAEKKDHHNWEIIGEITKKLTGDKGKVFRDVHKEVEEEEDEHYYHSEGWSRELWIESMGLPAVLPPPEEEKDVKTAIGAARAKKARKEML